MAKWALQPVGDYNSMATPDSHTYSDEKLKVVCEGDKVMEAFKFDSKSNYKRNLANSLGFLEDEETFVALHSLFAVLGEQYISLKHKKDGEGLGTEKTNLESLNDQVGQFKKYIGEVDLERRRDLGEYKA